MRNLLCLAMATAFVSAPFPVPQLSLACANSTSVNEVFSGWEERRAGITAFECSWVVLLS